MKKLFFLSFLGVCFLVNAQLKVRGQLVDTEQNALQGIEVFNENQQKKTVSDPNGNFEIDANSGDQIYFLSKNFLRKSIIAKDENVGTISLSHFVQNIAEVKLVSKSQMDKVQDKIGVARTPEKPRIKAREVVDDLLLPLLGGSLKIDYLYQIISGNSRRFKSLYRYEDRQEQLQKVVDELGKDFFAENSIPIGKEKEFVEYLLNRIKDQNNMGYMDVQLQLPIYAKTFVESIKTEKS